MTNQDLAGYLSELVDKTANTLALSPIQIVDEQLELVLNQLTEEVKQQVRTGLAQKHAQALLALISGLYLWNGSLERSHKILQDLENNMGSYLHGILHRIEPDYPNAKYWFRMAGDHPNGGRLWRATLDLLRESAFENKVFFQRFVRETVWNPMLFTDMAATYLQTDGTGDEGPLMEQIQALELQLLLEMIVRELDIH